MRGIVLDDVVGGIKTLTDKISEGSDNLLQQARMDGEARWFTIDPDKVKQHDSR
jgi:hypothetical protein